MKKHITINQFNELNDEQIINLMYIKYPCIDFGKVAERQTRAIKTSTGQHIWIDVESETLDIGKMIEILSENQNFPLHIDVEKDNHSLNFGYPLKHYKVDGTNGNRELIDILWEALKEVIS